MKSKNIAILLPNHNKEIICIINSTLIGIAELMETMGKRRQFRLEDTEICAFSYKYLLVYYVNLLF